MGRKKKDINGNHVRVSYVLAIYAIFGTKVVTKEVKSSANTAYFLSIKTSTRNE